MTWRARHREHLEGLGLGAYAEKIIARTHEEIWITATPSESLALGQSRIGGVPDLPDGVAWPRQRWTHAEVHAWPEYARRDLDEAITSGVVTTQPGHFAAALPFVAQLDLRDVAPFQTALPRNGHLWLFADQTSDGGEVGGLFCVASAWLFEPQSRSLRRAVPPPVPEQFAAGSISFAPGTAMPDFYDEHLALPGAYWHTYEQARVAVRQPEPRHALLPGPDCGVIGDVPPPGYTALLRVDTDDALDMNWGDAAWITFAVPDAALAEHRFDGLIAIRWYG
ncbi:DUF1963 domain-containing protein [Dactylosporangium sp. NPDC051485]|uniref:DUF1963 domain-containing protein n=1 Tax=Dactylosporangium sp. NPDC051485 TaxID=3154846 RepID=UPI003445AB4F